MTDPFSFIFSRARQLEPGVVCRNVSLDRSIVEQIIASSDLSVMPVEDWVAGCQTDLANYLMMPDDAMNAETCFDACASALLLLLALDKIDQVAPPTAGLLVVLDRNPDDSLDGTVMLRLRGYDRVQVDTVTAVMRAMGSQHRDLGAETLAAQQQGATLH